ncbi:hypothetical protein [Streptomyces sp. NPDC001933]
MPVTGECGEERGGGVGVVAEEAAGVCGCVSGEDELRGEASMQAGP